MNTETRNHYVQMALSLGVKVYQHDPERDTWFYYTDGTNIGYCQFPDRDSASLCTVHMPNTTTGTGFRFTDRWQVITPEMMREAMLAHSPSWASGRDREASKKWKSWDAFHNNNTWHKSYREVTA